MSLFIARKPNEIDRGIDQEGVHETFKFIFEDEMSSYSYIPINEYTYPTNVDFLTIGEHKTHPDFVRSFLNNSHLFIDLRYDFENNLIFEQKTPIKFDLENNEIIFGKIDSEGDILNALHAISTYYDLITPQQIKDGYVENLEIFDLEGRIQQISKPVLKFDSSLVSTNKVYLDHPERIQGSFKNKLKTFKTMDEYVTYNLYDLTREFKDSNLEKYKTQIEKKYLENEEKYKNRKLVSKNEVDWTQFMNVPIEIFQSYNKGTDFLILKKEEKSIENLLNNYNGAMQNKVGIVISNLVSEYADADLNIVENASLDFCIDFNCRAHKASRKVEKFEHIGNVNEYYEKNFKKCNTLDELINLIRPKWCEDQLKEKFNGVFNTSIHDFIDFPVLENESILKYGERILSSNNKSGDHQKLKDFLIKYLKDEGMYNLQNIYNIASKDFAVKLFYERCEKKIHDEDILVNLTEKYNQFQRDKLNNYNSQELIKWGLTNKTEDMLMWIQTNNNIFNKFITENIIDEFAEIINKEYIDAKKYLDGFENPLINPLSFWVKKYPLLKNKLKKDYQAIIREVTNFWVDSIDEPEMKNINYIFKKWNKERTRQNDLLIIKNNDLMRKKQNFTKDYLKNIFKNKSFFVVPTFLLSYSNKQYNRFLSQIEKFKVPIYTDTNFSLIYDLRRSESFQHSIYATLDYSSIHSLRRSEENIRNRIPEKVRNEFRLNPLSENKQMIGVRKYKTQKNAQRSQKVSYFTDLSYFK